MLGFAMPFPLCLHEDLPVVLVALLGYIPPLLATVTAIAYGIRYNYRIFIEALQLIIRLLIYLSKKIVQIV